MPPTGSVRSVERLGGVDVARGLAVLGMFTAHLAPGRAGDPWPQGAVQVADGRSAALFVVLAGVSVALLSGGARPVRGELLARARRRIAVRGALLVPIGLVLELLNAPLALILLQYALLFVLVLPFLALRAPVLLALAGVVALAAPPLVFAARDRLEAAPVGGEAVTDLLVGPYYPVGVWFAYLLVGLAVGRMDLRESGVRRLLVLVGAALAVGAHTVSWAWQQAAPSGDLVRLITTEPHASTTFEVVANTGVSLAVLGLCLMAQDAAPRLLAPVAATGALALTAYVGHVVAIGVLGSAVVWQPRASTWAAFIVVTVVLCTAWRAWLGRGPLERVLHEVSTRVSGGVEPRPDGVAAPAAPRQG